MKTKLGKRSIYAAGFALALPFGLAACGDDSEDTDDETTVEETENTDTETDTDTDTDTEDGTDETDSVDADEDADNGADGLGTDDGTDTDTDTTDDGTDGDLSASGDKPSPDEVVDGLAVILEDYGVSVESMEAAGISGEQLDSYYTCIVDDVYDDVSAETLNSIANQQDQMLPDDQAAFNEAVTSCQGELGL